jgi:hypothetical protein
VSRLSVSLLAVSVDSVDTRSWALRICRQFAVSERSMYLKLINRASYSCSCAGTVSSSIKH